MNKLSIINILKAVDNGKPLSRDEIVYLLDLNEPDLDVLCQRADEIREQYMGNEIHIRGIVEFSNNCAKNCNYCGIRGSNTAVERYRMSQEEILQTCKDIERRGQTTVVLQSGEDPYYTREVMGDIISAIRERTTLAVTISVGNRDRDTYAYWKEKGMDRYLLRFETSNECLFKKCHPDDTLDERVACLETLKGLGVQTGSGFLIGIPGETKEDLAQDILFCTKLDLDMIGIGPFITHEETPFVGMKNPFDKDIFVKAVAILRLLNKQAHIPATTAYDAVFSDGRNRALKCGANIFMPNATPGKYRKHYLLYPGKPCVDESGDECAACVLARIKALGRSIGKGPGHSLKRRA